MQIFPLVTINNTKLTQTDGCLKELRLNAGRSAVDGQRWRHAIIVMVVRMMMARRLARHGLVMEELLRSRSMMVVVARRWIMPDGGGVDRGGTRALPDRRCG